MKGILKLTLLVLLVLYSTSKIYTPEEYAVARLNVEFDTLEYEDYLEVAKTLEANSENRMSYEDFKNQTLEQIKRYNEEAEKNAPELRKQIEEELKMISEGRHLEQVPAQYDWRDANRACMYNIPIKHQKNCGSCFAFATSFALAKRFCMTLNPAYAKLDLSPQDIMECDYKHMKCQGGIVPYTWEYLEREGVVTEQCKPYYSGDNGQINYCQRFCQNYTQAYKKYKAIPYSMKHIHDPNQIKFILMKEGPMVVGIKAYQDLQMYRGGIYIHTPVQGEKEEGHAITLVGWGYDSRYGDYWIIANSWGAQWGENGYFKIPFNQCNVANMSDGLGALASFPDLTK